MEITGTNALVTGAATGIGRATAVALARAGSASVVVADIDEVEGAKTAELVEASGATAHFIRTDVSVVDDLRRLFAEASGLDGGLQIVHNNAGIVSGGGEFVDQPIERIELLTRINLVAIMVGTRLAIDALGDGGGAIVNTASIAALRPMPTDPPYAATKAAVVNFTQALTGLRESHGIRVNAVLPGMVDTPIIAKTGDNEKPAPWLADALSTLKILQPEDIAAVVLDLVRDDSRVGEAAVVANEA